MADVRVVASVPTSIDFSSAVGSPVVINSSTAVAYFIRSTGTVTPLVPDTSGVPGVTTTATAASVLTIVNGLITGAT